MSQAIEREESDTLTITITLILPLFPTTPIVSHTCESKGIMKKMSHRVTQYMICHHFHVQRCEKCFARGVQLQWQMISILNFIPNESS